MFSAFYMKTIFCFYYLMLSSICFSQTKFPLKLWYTNSSGHAWENALPIGNGRLGAMVYGNVPRETIQLNEHTVWSGVPNRNDNPNVLAALPEVRKLIFEGKQKEAEQLDNKAMISKKSQGQMFLPVENLNLTFDGHQNYTNYYRELDIERAVAKTSYTVDGVTYTREVLASFPDQLIIIQLTASEPSRLSFSAFYSTQHSKPVIKTASSNELTIAGSTSDQEGIKSQIRFKGITRIKTQGGTVSASDTALTVRGANAATIYLSIATNFVNYSDISADENVRAATYLTKAYPKAYAAMLPAHSAAYQKYFNRVKLDLGSNEAANLPINERLKN